METTLPPPVPSAPAAAPNMPPYSNRSPRAGPSALEASRVHSPSYAAKANPSTQIDPRLMSPQSQTHSGHGNDSRPSLHPLTPHVSQLPLPNGRDAPSSGPTVPSIGALMSGPGSSPYSKANGSPSSLRAEGPKDIPSEKIGFGGEDMRALRQLDRVFTA
jgi:hypothetical protein